MELGAARSFFDIRVDLRRSRDLANDYAGIFRD